METPSPDAGADEAQAPTPVAVRVLDVSGFIDDFGDRWHWLAGTVVRNTYVIGLLEAHCVPVVPIFEE